MHFDDVTRVLKTLHTGTPELEACALVSDSGELIASSQLSASFAGLSSTMLNLGRRASAELMLGSLDQVLIRSASGYTVMMSAGPGKMLVVLTTSHVRLGLVFHDMAKATKELARVS